MGINLLSINSLNDMASALHNEMLKNEENELLLQLNEFISRGAIVIEKTQPVLIQDLYSNTIKISSKIRLVLKDQEYIETLEKENNELKEKLSKIEAAFK